MEGRSRRESLKTVAGAAIGATIGVVAGGYVYENLIKRPSTPTPTPTPTLTTTSTPTPTVTPTPRWNEANL